MGKRKIGEIYNKPIIEGDINLKTPNEIHQSQLFSSNEDEGVETSKFILKPNGWCWKLKEDLIQNDDKAQFNALNMYFVQLGRLKDAIFKLSYGSTTSIKLQDERQTYLTIGSFNNSTDSITRIIALREAYGAEMTVGNDSFKGDCIFDAYKQITGQNEEDFLNMMSNSGFVRITNEEYEALIK